VQLIVSTVSNLHSTRMEVYESGLAVMAGSPIEEEPALSTSTTVVKPLRAHHTHTVIFLHGREDYGTYMAEILYKTASDRRTFPERFPSTR
jgi:lysophospholipase-2